MKYLPILLLIGCVSYDSESLNESEDISNSFRDEDSVSDKGNPPEQTCGFWEETRTFPDGTEITYQVPLECRNFFLDRGDPEENLRIIDYSVNVDLILDR